MGGVLSNMQTGCIVKDEAPKSPLFWRCSGGFDFLRCACSLGFPARDPWNLVKSPTFTNTPCKPTLYNTQKPGDHPNLRKNALGVKRPFSELSESFGVFILGAALGIRNSVLGVRNSILGMASHDLSNTKTTILGATPWAIPGIDGNPHERSSFAPPFSERFFENWGGPHVQEIPLVVHCPSFKSEVYVIKLGGVSAKFPRDPIRREAYLWQKHDI